MSQKLLVKKKWRKWKKSILVEKKVENTSVVYSDVFILVLKWQEAASGSAAFIRTDPDKNK